MWRSRQNIYDEFQRMHEEMEQMMNHFWNYGPRDDSRLLSSGKQDVVPSNMRQAIADVYETDKEIIATVDIPGVDKKDITIDATDNSLQISVEKKKEKKEDKKGVYRIERSYAGFYRSIPLPEYADKDKVGATYNNGVLEIKIPKLSVEGKGHKRIEVK
jgi:HSP20 family protein